MVKKLFAISLLMLITCKTNELSEECTDPGKCSQCFKVYDENEKFITQGSVSGNYISWNGTDCKGNKVPCGKYTVYLNYNGSTLQKEMAVIDENAVVVSGQKSRDSLKTACRGKYFETYEETPFYSGTSGICCQ